MRMRRRIALLWCLTGTIVLLLLLKFFVADVYRVDSGSMRPTIFGGRERADAEEEDEHVLVRYGRLEPERFDLVVIRSPNESRPLVKRVCGLPGEDIMIRDGDLFIDRERLPADAPRPPPVPIYDDRLPGAETLVNSPPSSVRRDGLEWAVDGAPQPPGTMLLYNPRLRDDYLDRNGRRVAGVVEVNDAVLEIEFRIEPPLAAQKLRFRLHEQADVFEVVLAAGPEACLKLLRSNWRMLAAREDPASPYFGSGEQTLAEEPVALEAGRWYALSFANIDNHLYVRCPALAQEVWRSYKENQPWKEPTVGFNNIGSRVRFGAEGGEVRFRAVRILRDLYYTDTDSGRYAVDAPVSLGPDHYFVLGDNSAASTDSRHFGPIKAVQILGRPMAIVWPRPRWLRAVARP